VALQALTNLGPAEQLPLAVLKKKKYDESESWSRVFQY
jgi:hypothetical protein